MGFFNDRTLLEEKKAAKIIKYISNKCLIIDDKLYKRGYVIYFLTCLDTHYSQVVLLKPRKPVWKAPGYQIIDFKNWKVGILLAYYFEKCPRVNKKV